MKKDYTKLWDTSLGIQGQCQARGKSGEYHNARPLPYYGFIYRIRDAWNVLTLKADALYWTIDCDTSSTLKDKYPLTWTCGICKEEKPDAEIKVISYPLKGFIGGTVNLKYCTNPECRKGAVDKANTGIL